MFGLDKKQLAFRGKGCDGLCCCSESFDVSVDCDSDCGLARLSCGVSASRLAKSRDERNGTGVEQIPDCCVLGMVPCTGVG